MLRKPFDFNRPLAEPLKEFTPSSVNMFLGCPQKYVYRYLLGLEPRKISAPLTIGSAFHAGIEAFHTTQLTENHSLEDDTLKLVEGVKAVTTTLQKTFGNPELDNAQHDFLEMLATTVATFKGWAINFSEDQPAGLDWTSPFGESERAFHARDDRDLSEPVNRMAGRTDQVVPLLNVDLTNLVDVERTASCIAEYKTRSSLGTFGFARILPFNRQPLWYYRLFLRDRDRHAFEIHRIHYNVTVKPIHRTPKEFQDLVNRKVEAMLDDPGKYFAHVDIDIYPDMTEQFDRQLHVIADRMDNIEPKAVIQNTNACEYPSLCPYIKLCAGGVRCNDLRTLYDIENLSGTYRQVDPHNELENE